LETAERNWLEGEPDGFLDAIRMEYNGYVLYEGTSFEEARRRVNAGIRDQIGSQSKNKAVVRAAIKRADGVFEEVTGTKLSPQ
jgi:hypothetical protein